MFNPYLNSKQIQDRYDITEMTLYRKLKSFKTKQTIPSEFISKYGRNKLYHQRFTDDVFGRIRRSKIDVFKNKLHATKWTYWCSFRLNNFKFSDNIVSISDLYERLSKISSNGNLSIFYIIEKNPSDEFYHTHFVIHDKKNEVSFKFLKSLMKELFTNYYVEPFNENEGGRFYLSEKMNTELKNFGILKNI